MVNQFHVLLCGLALAPFFLLNSVNFHATILCPVAALSLLPVWLAYSHLFWPGVNLSYMSAPSRSNSGRLVSQIGEVLPSLYLAPYSSRVFQDPSVRPNLLPYGTGCLECPVHSFTLCSRSFTSFEDVVFMIPLIPRLPSSYAISLMGHPRPVESCLRSSRFSYNSSFLHFEWSLTLVEHGYPTFSSLPDLHLLIDASLQQWWLKSVTKVAPK